MPATQMVFWGCDSLKKNNSVPQGMLGETLSVQLHCACALEECHEGIVTIDGSDKDDPEAIPRFIDAL